MISKSKDITNGLCVIFRELTAVDSIHQSATAAIFRNTAVHLNYYKCLNIQ